MEFNNCDIHDNNIIDKAVVLTSGQVLVEQGQEATKGSDPQKPRNSGAKRSAKPQRIVQDTFRYRWLDMPDGQLRLVRLYQKLIHVSCGWLDPQTAPEDWCTLFMGEPRAFTMKWLGTQAHLRYLFKLLLDRGYIDLPNKSVGRWEVLGSHFVNSKSKPFTDWDSQKDPKRIEGVISALAELLNIAEAE